MNTVEDAMTSSSHRTEADQHPSVPLGALRRLIRQPARAPGTPAASAAPLEHCALCDAALAPDHRHLVDRANRALVCACTACALLFERHGGPAPDVSGAMGGKYQTVPQRLLALVDFQLSDEAWDELLIPVNMAFIFRGSSAARPVAYYPSPAGATESLLSLEQWEALTARNPILAEMEPDVEALLINRVGAAREHYLVPIDACYQLVGIIRTTWRGLSGGAAVWQAIADFFADLRARAQAMPAVRAVKGAPDARPEL